MMRPNMKGNIGPRMARMAKSPKNRDHGRLLRQCEKRVAEDDLVTHSYELRERLSAPRFLKRDQMICKAGMKLVGLDEPLARSRSFIPLPS